ERRVPVEPRQERRAKEGKPYSAVPTIAADVDHQVALPQPPGALLVVLGGQDRGPIGRRCRRRPARRSPAAPTPPGDAVRRPRCRVSVQRERELSILLGAGWTLVSHIAHHHAFVIGIL